MPVYAMKDMWDIEIWITGKDPELYGVKNDNNEWDYYVS